MVARAGIQVGAPGVVRELGAGITPGICVDAHGAVHVVYMEGRTILYRRADGSALRFGPPESVPVPEGPALYNSPHLVCDANGTLHLVFERDWTASSRKAWYSRRQHGRWSEPLLAIDRSGTERRVNYPRLAVAGDTVFVGAFAGGGSVVAKLGNSNAKPTVTASVETPLWVAHPLLSPSGEILIVGRDGARGHKLVRYTPDLTAIGDPLLLSRGTPTKTFEPTAAMIDASGVVHVAGATGSPVEVLWYTTNERAAAGLPVILGPELGHGIKEFTYPVMIRDAKGRILVSFRDHATGAARLTMFDPQSEKFVEPITIAPATTRRLRWNPHLAAAPGGGVYVAWDTDGRVFVRAVGEAANAGESR
jgi:hypothetical protein